MSDIATALTNINAFEASHPQQVAWSLDRPSTLQRIRTLIQHPEQLEQRALNACGPAVFFRAWIKRDPVAAAGFACTLLRDGTARIGSLTVTAGGTLRAQNYYGLKVAANAIRANSMPEGADWMLLSALRDSENVIPYLGEPHTLQDQIAGLTLPMTLASWFTATNLYTSVVNDTDVLTVADMSRLVNFIPTSSTDIVLLVSSTFNAHLFPNLATRPAMPTVFAGLHIPNHYVLLTAPPSQENGVWANIEFWSWGRTIGGWVGWSDLNSKYFGPIVATR